MQKEDLVLQGLNTVFRSVFDDQSIILTPETCFSDIDEWDSLHHAMVISEIERHFKIRFKLMEILNFKTICNICDAVKEKSDQVV